LCLHQHAGVFIRASAPATAGRLLAHTSTVRREITVGFDRNFFVDLPRRLIRDACDTGARRPQTAREWRPRHRRSPWAQWPQRVAPSARISIRQAGGGTYRTSANPGARVGPALVQSALAGPGKQRQFQQSPAPSQRSAA
jgi:hypothetical protein